MSNEDRFSIIGYMPLSTDTLGIDSSYILAHFVNSTTAPAGRVIANRDGGDWHKEKGETIDSESDDEILSITRALLRAVRQEYTGEFLCVYAIRQDKWSWHIETAAIEKGGKE